MKSKKLARIASIALFTLLAVEARLAAQNNRDEKPKHHHYKLIDIGTFGGPASFINSPANAFPAMNDRGMTVGGSASPVHTSSTSDFFVCGGLEGVVPNVIHAFRLKNGAVADLGALPPMKRNCSNAGSINAAGEVAGASEIATIDPLFGVKEFRAVLWKNGKAINLKTLGGDESFAYGINDRGQVAGFALSAIPDPLSIFDFLIFGSSNGTQTRAFLWDKKNKMKDLGTLGGNDAWAEFINQHGQVAGFSYTSSTPNPGTELPPTHPFLWEKGKMRDLGTLGGTSAGSVLLNMLGGLNNHGEVVGGSNLSGDLTFHPFFWKKGKHMKDLGTLGCDCGTATAINDADQVVGRADVSGPCGGLANALLGRPSAEMTDLEAPDGAANSHGNVIHSNGQAPGQTTSHAFLWKPGMKKLTDLGTVNGDANSYAWAINKSSQVVGLSATESAGIYQAFLWENGGPMVDLNTLIPPNSSLYLNLAFAINNRGEIAGIGTPHKCFGGFPLCGHAFLLIPCD
jgi:probable HAF family extracellular repeat protein